MFFSKSALFSIAMASMFALPQVSATFDLQVFGEKVASERRGLQDDGHRKLATEADAEFKFTVVNECEIDTTFNPILVQIPLIVTTGGPLKIELSVKTDTTDAVFTLADLTPAFTPVVFTEAQPLRFADTTPALVANPPASGIPANYFVQTAFAPDDALNGLNGEKITNAHVWKLVVTDEADNIIDFGEIQNEAFGLLVSVPCKGDPLTIIKPFGVEGDPHFTTFADKHYDFQGACDLALVQNSGYKNGKGMHVHTRTKLFGSWSSVVSAAVKIGDDVIEVHGEDMALINGVEYPVPEIEGSEFNFPMTIGDYALTVQILGPHTRRHIIHMGDGEKIMINNFKEFVDVQIEGVKDEDYDGAVGMLGAYSQGGAMMGRDGKTVFEDADAFGQEWQVNPTDPHLFHIIDGPQYPARCNMPEAPTAEQRHLRAMAKKVSEDDAKKACANASRKENCIADVFGSDNLDMANIYTMGSL